MFYSSVSRLDFLGIKRNLKQTKLLTSLKQKIYFCVYFKNCLISSQATIILITYISRKKNESKG
jgi:hypothetical protein